MQNRQEKKLERKRARIRQKERTYRPSDAHAAKHHIHLLERQALRLGDVPPEEDGAAGGHGAEEDEGAVSDALQHVRRDLAHDEVGHPVRRGPERDAVRAVRERPHLRDEDPCTERSRMIRGLICLFVFF